MAEIESVLADILIEDPSVAAIFGEKIEPDPLTETEVPALTYKVVDKPRRKDVRVSWVRFQVTVWAVEYTDIQAGSTAVRRAFETFDMGVEDGITIIQITYLNHLDIPDPATGRRTRPMDFQVLYREE